MDHSLIQKWSDSKQISEWLWFKLLLFTCMQMNDSRIVCSSMCIIFDSRMTPPPPPPHHLILKGFDNVMVADLPQILHFSTLNHDTLRSLIGTYLNGIVDRERTRIIGFRTPSCLLNRTQWQGSDTAASTPAAAVAGSWFWPEAAEVTG